MAVGMGRPGVNWVQAWLGFIIVQALHSDSSSMDSHEYVGRLCEIRRGMCKPDSARGQEFGLIIIFGDFRWDDSPQ